ncbi:MAG: hypothetical protein KDC44_17920, partial [Phaeodactylibacter sp.]|nr:hypothetical protein [Phaeodactylibacter sp.]
MRSFFLSLFCVLLASVWVKGQNIPHANVTGPFGVQVNTFNGNLHVQHLALSLPNTGLSLELQFAYNSFRDTVQLGCGKGFSFSYQMYYEADAANTGYYLHYPDGRTVFFQAAGSAYEAPSGIFDTWEEAVPGQFVLTTKYGIRYSFENAVHRRLTQIEDTNGNTIQIAYTAGLPTTITDPSGRFVSLIWEGMLLQSIEDGNFTEPREILFQYDSEGHLLQFTDPLGESVHYSYNGDQLIKIINKRGDFLDLRYDPNGRVQELISCISKFIFQYNNQTHRTF